MVVAGLAIALDSREPRLNARRSTRGSARCGGAEASPRHPRAPDWRLGTAVQAAGSAGGRRESAQSRPARGNLPRRPRRRQPRRSPRRPPPRRAAQAHPGAHTRLHWRLRELGWPGSALPGSFLRPWRQSLWLPGTASGCVCGLNYVARSSPWWLGCAVLGWGRRGATHPATHPHPHPPAPPPPRPHTGAPTPTT